MLLTVSCLQPNGQETFIMGCVSSKSERDANFANNPNVFQVCQVMNVDDDGRRQLPSQLEVGDADLILHQRNKSPIRWPLRSLRRYGFDANFFSFECGRRCPTGPGIYAFHCLNAEILFNVVQSRVAARFQEQEHLVAANSNSHPRSRIRHSMPQRTSSLLFPNSGASSNGGLVVDQREDNDEEGSYLEPIRLQQQQQQQQAAVWSPHSRPLSSSSLISSSSSPISPSTGAGNLYANNEALLAAAAAAAGNDGPGLLHHLDPMMMMMNNPDAVLVPPPVAYANLHRELAVKDPIRSLAIDQDDLSADEADNQHHLYINVGPDIIEAKSRGSTDNHHMALPSLKQVNYVLLDLDKGSDSTTTASVTTTTTGGGLQANSPEGSLASFPESPHRTTTTSIVAPATVAAPAAPAAVTNPDGPAAANPTADGYATIDFDRTAALSNATGVAFANLAGCEEEEQGLRKTRHNSTMVGGGTAASGGSHAARLLGLNRQTSSVSE